MQRFARLLRSISLLFAAALAGCAELPRHKGLELQPPKLAADSVVLEVFLVRLPPGETAQATPIWAEIDELSLPAETRARLSAQGFRAGLTAGRIPVELERLMQLGEKSPAPASDAVVVDLQAESNVSRRILQMRPGRRGEIMASRVYDRLTMFNRTDQQVTGESYQQAQCCFAVSGKPQPNGHVRLEVLSEIQHGAPRGIFTPGEGQYTIETRRERVALDDLKIDVPLQPGQILVLGGAASTDGSLGSYFFTEDVSGGATGRLVLIRLAQSQQDGLFPLNDAPQ